MTSITVAELHFGVAKSQQPERNHHALLRFLAPLEIVPFGAEAAECYGKTKARLRSQGNMIGELDCLISAVALALKIPLVTNNTAEFERVPGLKLMNWAEPGEDSITHGRAKMTDFGGRRMETLDAAATGLGGGVETRHPGRIEPVFA